MTKPVQTPALAQTLGPGALVALGIGCIIGTGIFVLTGTAAATYAGPALTLSFLLAGVACALAGLSYSEFAAMLPKSGSAYSYTYLTLGRGMAWFIGWNLVLEYLVATATIAVGWSAYMVSLLQQLGIDLPAELTNAPFSKGAGMFALDRTNAVFNVPAAMIVLLMSIVCYIGVRLSSALNVAIVIIKVSVIVLLIGFGSLYVDPSLWRPYVPPNAGAFGEFGFSGVLRAAGVVFFAYIGFDAVSTAAQEAKNPSRNLPIGILGSLAICTALYMLVAAVVTGLVPYPSLNVPAPIAVALDAHPQLRFLNGFIKAGALAGMTSAIIVTLIAMPRIFYAMAQDRLLPDFMGRVHRTFHTPHVGTAVTGALAAVVAGTLPIHILGELVSIGTLLAFFVVCIAVMVLRRTHPDLHRPFRVPAATFTCSLGGAICVLMMLSLPADTWIRLVVWSALGFALYFSYGARRRGEPQLPQGGTGAQTSMQDH